MKTSNLNLYFNNFISPLDFFAQINMETSNYSDLMKKTGSTIPLYFDEDQEILINNFKLSKLLLDIIDNDYNLLIIGYICDCLTLGEKVDYSNSLVKEITFVLADPEINSLSQEAVSKIISLLKTA